MYLPDIVYPPFAKVDGYEFNCLFVYTLAKTYLERIYRQEDVDDFESVMRDEEKLL